MARTNRTIGQHSPNFVIPAGTQVVLKVSKVIAGTDSHRKPGSVGVVVQCPSNVKGPYVVQFADGQTVKAYFDEMSLRREEVETELAEVSEDLRPYIFYVCQVGSKAYGLSTEDSDDDLRGIYLPPARLDWSLRRLPEQLEFDDDQKDEVYWEIGKFLRLALKANPNVLETLWTPMIVKADETADELRSIRRAFLSKHLYKTYSGYVLSQFRRMANAHAKTGEYKSKHAMHLVRLLYSGISALRTGEIQVDVSDQRDELLHIRNDGLSFDEVKQKALDLDKRFQQAFEETELPEQPDYGQVDDFLIRARGGEWLMLDFPKWRSYIESLDYNPLFVTVSGAHLYGFPSPDSDIDLRGCHQLPLRDVVGLDLPNQTIEQSGIHDGIEVDVVSHDVGKYFGLLVKNNGYILEQVFSPLVVMGARFLDELRPLAQRCITRHHYHHYRGFYATQRKLIEKQSPKLVKPILYAYRVLLTGIHLLRTGQVEANLVQLNETFKLPYIDDLIASKTAEKIAPAELDWPFHEARLRELEEQLDQAFAESTIPEDRDRAAVNNFLISLRLRD